MKKKFKLVANDIDTLLMVLLLLLDKHTIISLYEELGNTTMTTAYKFLEVLWCVCLVSQMIIIVMKIKTARQEEKIQKYNEELKQIKNCNESAGDE